MSGHFLTRAVNKHPRKVLLIVLLVPILLLIMLLKSAGAGQTPEAPKKADLQRVEVLQVTRQSQYKRAVNIVGRVESGEQTTLGFERGGTLTLVPVDEGQTVVKGQLLAELDIQRLEAQQLEIDAAIKRTRADARIAKLSEQRIQQLVRDKLESPQRLDEARESTQAAMALVDEMLARRNSTEVEINKSRLHAPFDGVLINRYVDNGSVIAQGQPIFDLLRDGQLQVRMAMSSDDAFRLSQGQREILIKNDHRFDAVVISIGANRNIRSRTVDVIFALSSDAQGKVLQGDLLTLKLNKETEANGLWLPKSALTSSIRGLWSVYSVAQPGAEQTLSTRNVNVLYSDAKRVYVTGPIVHEEYIVASGVHRLVPEQLVMAALAKDGLYAGIN